MSMRFYFKTDKFVPDFVYKALVNSCEVAFYCIENMYIPHNFLILLSASHVCILNVMLKDVMLRGVLGS